MLLAAVVDIRVKGDETDFFLINDTVKRFQFEVQDRLKEYPDGPVSEWHVVQPPRKKKGIKGKMIVDHPGTKLHPVWDDYYRKAWKYCARPSTHLLHMDEAIGFEHMRSSPMLQIADVVVGAVSSYLRGDPAERFEILLPRFRRNSNGKVDGYGLVFDPLHGALWRTFRADYPTLC